MVLLHSLYAALFIWVFAILTAAPVRAQSIDPQYIFVRKDNTCSNCYNWNGYDPNQINMDAINEVFSRIGTKGTNARRVGIGVLFFYNDIPMSNLKASLSRLLDYSRAHDFPVFIALDGFQWWENRPDLWNWSDASATGYNPNNRNNVEWTCWDPSCAINKSWRNWGSEIQIKPHPNLLSPALLSTNKARLAELVPIIATWYRELPAEKKYLFGGLATGVEMDIGSNFYYYPNGIPSGQGLAARIQLGYAALKTSGLKTAGTITDSDINEVVRRYQTELNKTVFDLGIPRNKIYNHNGGKGLAPFVSFPAGVAFETPEASLNNYAYPGWSFYGGITASPQSFANLAAVLSQSGNGEWSSAEWLTFATDYNGWVQSLRNSLNYRNNRFVNVANWEGIRDKQYALDAIRTVAHEAPACWMITPTVNVSVSGNSAVFQWQPSLNTSAMYLNVSTVPEFTQTGAFKTINVANESATGLTGKTFANLAAGSYYWLLAADGCGNQRKIAYGSFQVGSVATPTPSVSAAPPADLNMDGRVDIFDYNILLQNFGRTGSAGWIAADIDRSGKVDIFDYTRLLESFGS